MWSNSITSVELANPISNTRFSDLIAFSNPFYNTDVRLLLKSELADELANLSPNDLTKRL